MIPPSNVIDSLDGGVIVLDPEQRVVVWNIWMASKSGIPAQQAIGATLVDVFPSLAQSHLMGAVVRALKNRLSTVMSHNLHRRVLPLYSGRGGTGEPIEQSVVIRPLQDHGYTACLIQITDITPAVKRDRHLRELTLYNRTLFETAIDPMATVTNDGLIKDANSAFELITGQTRKVLLGQHLQDVLGQPGQMMDLLQTVHRDGHIKDFVISFQCKDEDHPRHLSINAAQLPADPQGNLPIYLVARDLTDRIEAQRELENKNLIIERSNAELAEFAYVVSHDLRQPLRMVSSFLSLIERRLGANLDNEIKGFIDFAVNGAKRMDRLILDLLTYSRIGRMGPAFEWIKLIELLDDAQENLRPVIEESKARIIIPADLPDCFGSRTELLRLFQNLIDNAIKYADPNRPPEIEIGWRDMGRTLVLSVADNGVGIPPECHQRVFGLFQRLVSDQQKDGTGIGLAVCRKIVDHHQGRMWLESAVDQGSSFFVELPKASTPTA